ncbi:hypothetical protein ACJJTC_014842 [Scirpophaga incertulas]
MDTDDNIPEMTFQDEDKTSRKETEKTIPSEVDKSCESIKINEDKDILQTNAESLPDMDEYHDEGSNQKVRRAAATKAMQKIKEWTRDLNVLLLLSEVLPVGECRGIRELLGELIRIDYAQP